MLMAAGRVGRQMPAGGVANLLPTIDFSLLSGPLDPRITFTRTTTGTYYDATGTMQTAAINTPRFDNDPVSHVAKGLLVEEARTNQILNSGRLDNASWTAVAGTTTATATGAPDGTSNAISFVPNTSSVLHQVRMTTTVSILAGSTNSFSIFVKPNGYSRVFLQASNGASTNGFNATFDVAAGTVGSIAYIGLGSAGNVFIAPAGNGWYRCAISGIFDGTSLAATCSASVDNGVGTVFAGDGTSGLFMWGGQFEVGSFPTSYIPTAAAGVARGIDVAVVTSTPGANQFVNSINAEFMVPFASLPGGNTCVSVEIDDGSVNNTYTLRCVGPGTGLSANVFVAGALSGFVVSAVPLAPNVVIKHAGAFNASGLSGSGAVNGTVAPLTMTSVPAALNRLFIGNGRTSAMNGWVRRVRYWPRLLSNTELQQVTT